VLLLPALGLACASAAPPTPPPPVAPAADLPRSSIAAVLLHRDELGLTAAQVDALQQRDDALAREQAAIRKRLASGPDPRSASPSPSGSPGHGRHRGSPPPPSQTRPPDLLTRLDDDDTRAYLDAEQLLTEQQRPRAQEIASAYREALYDQQHPSRRPGHEAPDAGIGSR